MNSKRRAELQRKLSMGAVPRPPSDLLHRIKADIPQYLETPSERDRFSGNVAFTMRVAASILMLITTAFITLRLIEPSTKEAASTMASAPRENITPAVSRYQTQPSAKVAPEAQRSAEPVRLADELTLDIAQEVPQAPRRARAEAAGAPPPPPAAMSESIEEPRQQLADGRLNQSETGFAPEPALEKDALAGAETNRADEESKKLARDTAGIAQAPAPVMAAARPASSSLMSEAYASDLDMGFNKGRKSEVFGISVDPNVFDDVKTTLQEGKRPAAANVDIDALVNYFAGPPARTPRRVALEVEASPAPVEAEGDHAVLRFTIDTPRMDVPARSSTPPIGRDARIEIQIDPKAVANFRRIGGDAEIAPQSILYYNVSVTGLYQLELKPQLQFGQLIATVRLRYRSVSDGREHTITRVVRGKDLARDWARASRRHRLASLGAVWSESLKGSLPQAEVARRAQELSSQQPGDSRARELARAASATAAGGKR